MDVSCLCDCPTCYRLSNFPFSNREVSFRSCFMALHLKTEGDALPSWTRACGCSL